MADAPGVQTTGDGAQAARSSSCPATAKAPAQLPNTTPELETLAYWLAVEKKQRLDEVLLDERALAVQDEALRGGPDGSLRVVELQNAATSDELKKALVERVDGYRDQLVKGQYKTTRKDAPAELERAAASFVEQRELRVALAPVDLHCVPFADAILSSGGSEGFDRNRCSQARAQEPIEVLGRVGALRFARTKSALGFIDDDARLSAIVPAEQESAFRGPATLQLTKALTLDGAELPAATLLRAADGTRSAWLAKPDGLVRTRALSATEVSTTKRPLTWRDFLSEAFRYVRSPYGWGDANGGRDCSRFVLDVLAAFGLELPRTSSHQAQSGRYVVEVPPDTSETERLALLDEAHERGVVLVHFPGHIMFYLGRDKAGTPRVLHSFHEYLAPCPGGGETLLEVGRVAVTDLTLGKGTSRKSFLERTTHLTVFGKAPGYELLALSKFRAPVTPTVLDPKVCKDSEDLALFRSPREPDEGRPLRVIAVGRDDVRPASLWLVSPSGALIAPEVHDLGVGPYARWVEQAAPKPGKWRALLADGDNVLACEEFRVAPREKKAKAEPVRSGEQPAWVAGLRWERDTEALYAAFVEQLFSHPVTDLRSWASLSELLQKPERNLLFDHRGLGEDTALTLAPDCADLPYLLRAYFSWKVGLPFAFRLCSRGRAGAPPHCDEVTTTNEVPVSAKSELKAFDAFWRKLTNGVHSASGRTLPDDPLTDLYPVPLSRRALMPGTVFTDPYGHMIVVAKWLPQGIAGEGMLMGADAQPDATVGRRRFWRGNFLFTPDTTDVGAGFKRFRPVEVERESKQLLELDDKAIGESRDFPAASREQYTGTLDDFYVRMDQLIYPRPVAVLDRMRRVVDALFEQVERRVEAVDVGEAGLKEHNTGVVPIPDGYSIFETSGPWEDFATPSRDMRLLIAIDAVRAFPAQVRAQPARYGVSPGAPELAQVDKSLDQQLASRKFSYTRTDGSKFELSLADVVARVATLEVAYNPNDCPEYRWGAKPGTPENETCKRSAPAEQRDQMEKYRSWFHDRARPARP